VRRLDHLVQQFLEGRIDIKQVHAGGRHHHIASRHVGHANDAFQHLTAVVVNDAVVLGLGQGLDQLVGGVGAGVNEFGQFLQEAALVFSLFGARRMGV